uniref:Uncharacterized protein n=1 Tax=Plectus sambesii TaxID=2011161 RepID=A0A914XQV1_9BILA
MSSGSYPVLDSLKNLRIRVRLERIGSVAGALPSFAAFINEATDSRLTASINAGQEVDEFVFRWQQKVFSPREYARYSVASNCVTPREQQYHRDIMELRNTQGERTINRLFTYVGEDPLPEEITNKLVTANVEEEKGDSALAERLSNVRHRKVVPQSRLPSTALSNPVSDMPSAELMKKSRSAAVSSHVMYLMAYLGAKDVQDFQTIDQSDEKLLCKIRVIDDRIVEFKPDFNEPSQPHRIEGRMGVFNYFLSNASPKVSNEALENEEKREAKVRSTLFFPLMIGSFSSRSIVPV